MQYDQISNYVKHPEKDKILWYGEYTNKEMMKIIQNTLPLGYMQIGNTIYKNPCLAPNVEDSPLIQMPFEIVIKENPNLITSKQSNTFSINALNYRKRPIGNNQLPPGKPLHELLFKTGAVASISKDFGAKQFFYTSLSTPDGGDRVISSSDPYIAIPQQHIKMHQPPLIFQQSPLNNIGGNNFSFSDNSRKSKADSDVEMPSSSDEMKKKENLIWNQSGSNFRRSEIQMKNDSVPSKSPVEMETSNSGIPEKLTADEKNLNKHLNFLPASNKPDMEELKKMLKEIGLTGYKTMKKINNIHKFFNPKNKDLFLIDDPEFKIN
jgi:hypothetical protein